MVTRELTNRAETHEASYNTIESYLADYPLQKTNDYLHERTGGDHKNVNTWFFGSDRLVKAGEDLVVRTNNDTLYKCGYTDNRVGPVIIRVENPKRDRFVSIMVQDQRDFNLASILDANGAYALVKKNQTPPPDAKPIDATDDFHMVVIRIEVRDEADVPAALAVYRSAVIEGQSGVPLPRMDLLSRYRTEVRARAMEMIDYWKSVPINRLFGHPEESGIRVSDLDRAVGVLYNEGAPLPEHSTFASFHTDASGAVLRGEKGPYELTMKAPPVDAFWSITVYDTERGSYLFPNSLNRYSINSTNAVPNPNGTYTLVFKQDCTECDNNCIPVPRGAFEITGRFYKPCPELLQGDWQMPKPTLKLSSYKAIKRSTVSEYQWIECKVS